MGLKFTQECDENVDSMSSMDYEKFCAHVRVLEIHVHQKHAN